MAKKSSKGTRIKGDVNVKNGDVVAGDKTVVHGEEEQKPAAGQRGRKRTPGQRDRVIGGNLEVDSGDVVFGDKIIKFFQESLNIYVFKDIQQLALFLVVVLLVSGGIAGGIWYSKQPQKMTGDFNIAVAQFGEVLPNGQIRSSALSANISNTVFNFLDSEYKSAGLNVDVSHKNIPLILEDKEAESLAQRINADVIIYGNVYSGGDQAEFSPRFYISNIPDTDELTGQGELANPINFNTQDVRSDDTVNTELRARTAILVNFTKSLIYFSENKVDAARNSIQSAIYLAEALPTPFSGQEVLHLFAARIELDEQNYQSANAYLEEALNLNDKYARAFLARGNIYYVQAIANDYDNDLLSKAYEQYMLAYQAPGQPEGAYIPVKAHTGLGNVLVLQAQEAEDPDLFAQAIENYMYVVRQYESSPNPILLGNATIAYFGLGAAFERQGQTEQAIIMYEKAYALTDDPDFKNRIQSNITNLQNR